MKGIRFFIFVCSIMGTQAFAQTLSVDASYSYMYAGQWDKAIQTYNFSRPDLTEKQPLLDHGASASISYMFQSERSIKHGFGLSYSFFRSAAENPNFNNVLHLHILQPSYSLRHNYSETGAGLYSELTLSALCTGLFRRINGEPVIIDESRMNGLGIGGAIHFKTGYYVKLKGSNWISPFISLGYSPYLFSPKTEAVINQTQGLASKKGTQFINANFGLAFHFNIN